MQVRWPAAGETVDQYPRYLDDQTAKTRAVLVSLFDGHFAGYMTVRWTSDYAPFCAAGIPEIVDLNVLPQFRHRRIASTLMDAAEDLIVSRGDTAGIDSATNSRRSTRSSRHVGQLVIALHRGAYRAELLRDGAGAAEAGRRSVRHPGVVSPAMDELVDVRGDSLQRFLSRSYGPRPDDHDPARELATGQVPDPLRQW